MRTVLLCAGTLMLMIQWVMIGGALNDYKTALDNARPESQKARRELNIPDFGIVDPEPPVNFIIGLGVVGFALVIIGSGALAEFASE